MALGPAIGWTEEGIEAMERKNVSAVQTVYNILEQTPGNELIERGAARGMLAYWLEFQMPLEY